MTVAADDRRQENLFDTSGGYFSNDPLQLWRLTWVVYTDAAFDTPEGRQILAQLEAQNGISAEGWSTTGSPS